jgi:pimeloyl-ACP methyl ester carboxylesterase
LTLLEILGSKTYVYDQGSGRTTFMLIHGAAYSHELWSKQLSSLSKTSRTIAIDLPGHGASDKLPSYQKISIQTYSDHVHAVLSKTKCQSAVLVGHSMGGAISMRCCLDHPNAIKALVLVGTGAKLGVSPQILQGLLSNFEQTIAGKIGVWSFSESAKESLVEESVKVMLRCKPDIALADFEACNEFDIRDSVSRISVPTLVIVGNEDKMTPIRWSEFLNSKIAGSEIRIIRNAGHMAMLEKYEEVNRAIESFVSKLT